MSSVAGWPTAGRAPVRPARSVGPKHAIVRPVSPAAGAGLFGQGVVRTINGEGVVWLCGGGRALLLQLAHPFVADAVLKYSRFRSHPLARLHDTLAVSFAYLFGDAAQARAAVSGVNRLHQRIGGTLEQPVGTYPAGTTYRALDPDLLLWVYATSVDSWLIAYTHFVQELTPAQQQTYWAEAREAAPVWRIPPEQLPAELSTLRTWMSTRIEYQEVVVSQTARDMARAVFRPPSRWALWPFLAPLEPITVWLLPPAIRAGYGYTWGPRREAVLAHFAAASRWLVPRVPPRLRKVPAAR
jgi:uncharacterized protein (DUF2236 family)